jgi:hypothetical protein
VQEGLLHDAAEAGIKLSASEIKYRLQAARAYGTKAAIASIAGVSGSWRSLCDAGFPPAEVPADVPEEPETGQAPFDFGRWEQVELFPGFTPAVTLLELETYCKEQDRMTENFAARGARRRAYLGELVAAAGGDMTVSYDQARRALRERALARS